jgi:hypothetical protein
MNCRDWLLAEKERLGLGTPSSTSSDSGNSASSSSAAAPSVDGLSDSFLADLAERMARVEALNCAGLKDIDIIRRFYRQVAARERRGKDKKEKDDEYDEEAAAEEEEKRKKRKAERESRKQSKAAALAALTGGGLVGGLLVLRDDGEPEIVEKKPKKEDGGEADSDTDDEEKDEAEEEAAAGASAAAGAANGLILPNGTLNLPALLAALKSRANAGTGSGSGSAQAGIAALFSTISSGASVDRYGNPTVPGLKRLATLEDWVNFFRLRPLYDKMVAEGSLPWRIGGASSVAQPFSSSSSSSAAAAQPQSNGVAPSHPSSRSSAAAGGVAAAASSAKPSSNSVTSSSSIASLPLPLQMIAQEEAELPGCPDTCSSTSLSLSAPLPTVLKNRRRKRKPDHPLRLTDEAHYYSARADADDFLALHLELRAIERSCRVSKGEKKKEEGEEGKDGSSSSSSTAAGDAEKGSNGGIVSSSNGEEVDFQAFLRKLNKLKSRIVVPTPTMRRVHRHDSICAGGYYLHFHKSQMKTALYRHNALGAATGLSIAVSRASRAMLHYIRTVEQPEKRNAALLRDMVKNNELSIEQLKGAPAASKTPIDVSHRPTAPATKDPSLAKKVILEVAEKAARARRNGETATVTGGAQKRARDEGSSSSSSSSAAVDAGSEEEDSVAVRANDDDDEEALSPAVLAASEPTVVNGMVAVTVPSPFPLTAKEADHLLSLGMPGKREAAIYPLFNDCYSLANALHRKAQEAALKRQQEEAASEAAGVAAAAGESLPKKKASSGAANTAAAGKAAFVDKFVEAAAGIAASASGAAAASAKQAAARKR